MDAYCHLDMQCEFPIADIEGRMKAADVVHALLVETWDGRNHALLETLARCGNRETFSIALCYRAERVEELREHARAGRLSAMRMSTADLSSNEDFCSELDGDGICLIAHAEAGPGALAAALSKLHKRFPTLQIYVPHLGWPTKDGKVNSDWEAAVNTVAGMPAVTVGVSAISHFSNQPYPHDDVRDLAFGMLSKFPPGRIVIGSDYPLFDKDRYGDYMRLARDWVKSVHSGWESSAGRFPFLS